jgi:outer membrane lipoprotein SlyB
MIRPAFRVLIPASLLLVAACTTMPSGPSVMALPGSGKSFDQFRADDFYCRQYAGTLIGGTTPSEAATNSGVTSAVAGTALGAAAGAAFNGGRGAAAGAGAGLLLGSLMGTGAAQTSSYALQQNYDAGYIQCMYAKGERVPVSGNFISSPPPGEAQPEPQPQYAPPPPNQYQPKYPPPPPGR